MKTLPRTSVSSAMPSLFVAPSNPTPSSPVPGATSNSRVVFKPNFPQPTTSNPSGRDASKGLDDQVLKKLLISVEKIQEILETNMLSTGNGDSKFESFTTAAMSSSSRCSSLSTDYGSQSSSISKASGSQSSSQYRPGKPWNKSQLREENICLKFQHDSCKFSLRPSRKTATSLLLQAHAP